MLFKYWTGRCRQRRRRVPSSFNCCNRRAIEAGLISVDDAGLRMRWIAESLAEQAFGRRGIAQRRQQEVDGGTGGIDGPIEVTPTAFHSNIRLIDPPGFVGRLEMTAQPLFQFGTVTLNPTPDRRVIHLQTAFGEQLFDIAERQRVPKIPAHGTKNHLRRRLPPLEHYRSGCVLHNLFRLPVIPAKVATHPSAARFCKQCGTALENETPALQRDPVGGRAVLRGVRYPACMARPSLSRTLILKAARDRRSLGQRVRP